MLAFQSSTTKDTMTKKYLYTSHALPQLSHAEQEQLFASIEFDLIVYERHSVSNRPHRAWNGLRALLRSGDLVAIASLSVFLYGLPTLNKQLSKLLARGVTIQVGFPNFTIHPASNDAAFQLILAYDAHRRNLTSQNVKAGLATSARGGRPSRLTVDQLPEIRKMISGQKLSMKDIAQRLKVSRSTLYSFVKNHGAG
jgi:DNA invertase Pin-like site-specific DNA recombinase